MLLFFFSFFCGMAHQVLYSQTNSDSDETVTNLFYSPSGKWMKTTNKDCMVWDSFPREKESVTWSGDTTNGKAFGFGKLQWFTDGTPTSSYEGQLKDGMSDGHGIDALKDGKSFEGDWEKGSLVSKTMIYRDGNDHSYKGEQVGGFKDGQGEEMMPGGKYIGHFKHNRFDGKGEMILANGDKITGEWADSKLVGIGTYTSKDGQTIKVKMTEKGIVNAE